VLQPLAWSKSQNTVRNPSGGSNIENNCSTVPLGTVVKQ
jgi:hypothetical protein